MKSLQIFFFCFLVADLYLSCYSISSSAQTIPLGRQPMRKLSMSFTKDKSEDQKIKVTDAESDKSPVQEISVSNNYVSSNSNLEELVYQIDYHGVTTHPTPTPRHSKP